MDWIWLKKSGKSKEEFLTCISSGKIYYEKDIGDVLLEAIEYCGGFKNLPEEIKKEILDSFKYLSEQEAAVIKLSFGISEESSHTLDKIAKQFDLSPERAKQFKENVLKKLKIKKDIPEENKNNDTEQQ